MNILAHRGFWEKEDEKNSRVAIERALKHGFGIETDIRDFKGELVIAHDIADENSLLFEDFLSCYDEGNYRTTLALNIKADGLQVKLSNLLEKYKVDNYFVFDMSLPEQLKYNKGNFKVFARMSEYEKKPYLIETAQGIWLDAFNDEWYEMDTISKFVGLGNQVCIVSPELHNRPYEKLWMEVRETNFENLLICTDFPDKAKAFFK